MRARSAGALSVLSEDRTVLKDLSIEAFIPGGGSNTNVLEVLRRVEGSLGWISHVRKSRNLSLGFKR